MFRMADFFLDSNEQPAAETSEVAVSDPAADFLAGEQSDLAEIEGQVYDQVPVAEGGFAEIIPEQQAEIVEEVDNNNNGIFGELDDIMKR